MNKILTRLPCIYHFITAIAGALFIAAIFRNAWAADDAYIMFRSVEQLFAGHGPRWNIVDRVEVYTSPLWFWLTSAIRIFSKDIYLNTIITSLVLCVALIIFLHRFFGEIKTWLVALLLLATSCAFMDFTTSGLEYPLIYLLCACFFWQYFEFCKSPSESRLRILCVIGSLFLITRHDLLLTILPALLHSFWSMRHIISLSRIARLILLLFLPLFLWTLFSLVYYGVPLPNTAYAKLGLKNVPHLQLIEQGIFYFYWGLKTDITSVLLIFTAIVAGFITRDIFHRIISITLLLVVGYILWVSGDFMAGRFYAHLVLISIIQLITLFKSRIIVAHFAKYITLIVILVSYAIFYPSNPLNTPNIFRDSRGEHRVSGERGNYSWATSIWVYLDPATPYFPYFDLYEQAHHLGDDGKKSERYEGVGMIGYGAKLDFYIDDYIGLTDFFRARLPVEEDFEWMTGHTIKYYPEGYPESLIDQKADLKDPYLNEYLSIVMKLTQSKDLWSGDRLLTIIKFNLGMYDYLLEKANIHWPTKEQWVNRACNHSWQRSDWLRKW